MSQLGFKLNFQLTCALACCASFIYILVTTVSGILSLYSPIQHDDQIHFILDLNKYLAGTYSWRDLLSFHNEHRLVFPRLFYFLDYFLASLTNKFNLVAIFCLQLLHFFLVIKVIFATTDQKSKFFAASLFGITGSLFFNAAQLDNFTFGFQVCFILVYFAVSIAIFSMLRACSAKSNAWFAASLGAGLVANFSLGNGILIWPLLVGIAFVKRAHRLHLVTLFLSALVVISLYLTNYTPLESSTHRVLSPQSLKFILHFILANIGNPIHGSGLFCSKILGLIILALTFYFTLFILKNKLFSDRNLFLLSNLFFCLGSIGLAAASRFQFGIALAVISRYVTTASILIAYALILCISLALEHQKQRLANLMLIGATALVLCMSYLQRDYIAPFHGNNTLREIAALALKLGIKDEELIRRIHLIPASKTLEAYATLADLKLAEYHHAEELKLNQTLDADYQSQKCLGSIELVSVIKQTDNYKLLSGWIYHGPQNSPNDKLYVIDKQNLIAGIGKIGYIRPDILSSQQNVKSIFTGFEVILKSNVLEQAPAALQFYVENHHTKVTCQISFRGH